MSFGMRELNRRCNQVIKDYLNKGFEISPFTLGGSFSITRSYIDLYNPKEKNYMYRIWFINSDVRINSDCYTDALILSVKKYNFNINKGGRTMWPDEGEEVYKKIFYVVRYNRAYSDNPDEVMSIFNLNKARKELKRFNISDDNRRFIKIQKLPESFIDHIMEKINSIRGFKRATASCIDSVMLYNETRYNYIKSYKVMRCRIEYKFNNKSGSIIIG